MKLTITYYVDFFNYPMGKKPSLENCKKCSLDGKPCDVMSGLRRIESATIKLCLIWRIYD
jgi:hypothetical protein